MQLVVTDVDSTVLSATISSLPLVGVLMQTTDGLTPTQNITTTPTTIINNNHIVLYAPVPDDHGGAATDFFYSTFSYYANDGQYDSNIGIVNIRVVAVNDPPVCYPHTHTMTEDDVKLITLPVDDIDGDDLTVVIVTVPLNGSLYQPTASLTLGSIIVPDVRVGIWFVRVQCVCACVCPYIHSCLTLSTECFTSPTSTSSLPLWLRWIILHLVRRTHHKQSARCLVCCVFECLCSYEGFGCV